MDDDKLTKNNETITVNSDIAISSRRRRFSAYIIDKLILGIIYSIFIWIGEIIYMKKILLFLWYLTPALYFIIAPITPWWATAGQRFLNIYLCDSANFKQISFLTSFIRFILFKVVIGISMVIALLFSISSVQEARQVIKKLENYGYHYVEHTYVNHKKTKDEYIEADIFNEKKKSDKRERDIEIHEISHNHYDKYILKQNRNMNFQFEKELLQILLRFIGFYFLAYSFINIAPTFIGSKKQTLYDIISKTCVVRGSK